MSNPTANFGWVMPTATDLVTDLPADFAVFGQAVDTSMSGLLGGTTGQILSKTSGTNMAFTWVTPNPGDITGVTAGTGISGGGTSGDVTITNSMATAMTTSGDLIQATGSGTFARLGTGTSGQYLTTNGTTNSWGSISAGSLTLLSTTTLSGASTTVSSISQSYTNLLILMYGVNVSTSATQVRLNCNNTTSKHSEVYTNGAATWTNFETGTNFILGSQTWATGSTDNTVAITISNYSSTTARKPIIANGHCQGANLTSWSPILCSGSYIETTAVSSIVFSPAANTFSAGTVLIYGVK